MNNEPIGKSDFKKLKDAVEKGGGSLEMFEEYFEKLWNANKPKEREITMWVDLRGYARYQSMLYKQFKPEATDKEVEEYRLKMIEKLEQEEHELNNLNK